ncbi:MAG: type I CRISPR-associated protein Cas8a1/Csx8 [Tissierellia bacterium]|nr:type I CRISPR-associated protein Cas8a1/Csx8 [Tissierellia bacterium]
MIQEGEFIKKGIPYDRKILPSDWRFSAALVGLERYLKKMGRPYAYDREALYYNYEDVTDDRAYAQYVEKRYEDILDHRKLEKLLTKEDLSQEEKKEAQSLLKTKSGMKKYLGQLSLENPDQVLETIEDKRTPLTLNLFKFSQSGYRKFANESLFLGSKEDLRRNSREDICRLRGYSEDMGRKTNSLGFAFKKRAREVQDWVEFDFIPFAFTRSREAIFLNNNASIENLIKSNRLLDLELEAQAQEAKEQNKTAQDFRSLIFYQVQEGSIFLNYDVEVILKSMERDFYESLFVRQEAVRIFEDLGRIDRDKGYIKLALKRRIRIRDNDYINIMEEVTQAILGLCVLDPLIVYLLRDDMEEKKGDQKKASNGFVISQLIRINRLIYNYLYQEGEAMTPSKKSYYTRQFINAGASAEAVKAVFRKRGTLHKLDSYRAKLIGALSARDTRRVYDIMLQLSSYAQVPFEFMDLLYEDFDQHSNLVYQFTNQLNDFRKVENPEENTKEAHHE